MARDIVKGMIYVHQHGVTHHDLKVCQSSLASIFHPLFGSLYSPCRSGGLRCLSTHLVIFLQPDNLMLGAHNIVKVVDFGFAEKRLGPPGALNKTAPKGSPLWMAPEVMLNIGDNERSDVYSWGLILWQLLTREKEPFAQCVLTRWLFSRK